MAWAPFDERGLIETLRSARGCLYAQAQEHRDRFDLRYDTDTERHLSFADLVAHGEDVPPLWRYFPTLEAPFHRMMSALPIDHREFVFIDLGSGKGRALLLASHYPFRHIIGVEMSPALHTVAARNIHIFRSPDQRCHSFELCCEDAANFTPPSTPTVFYLFQPFPMTILEAVLANLAASLKDTPRDVLIAYMNPIFADTVLATGLFERQRNGRATQPGEFNWAIFMHTR